MFKVLLNFYYIMTDAIGDTDMRPSQLVGMYDRRSFSLT